MSGNHALFVAIGEATCATEASKSYSDVRSRLWLLIKVHIYSVYMTRHLVWVFWH